MLVSCREKRNTLVYKANRSKRMASEQQFQLKPRHKYLLRIASPETTANKLGVLHRGVFLRDSNQLVWLDQEKNLDCYMLFPRQYLTISNEHEWTWQSQDIDDVKESKIEVVKLTEWTRWVEVKGKFSTVNLQIGITYRVSFIVKLDNHTSMLNLPITLSIVLPNGTRQEIQESVSQANIYCNLAAGKFLHKRDTIGNMDFSLKQSDSTWKKGIVIMGVQIKPDGTADKNVFK